MRFRNSSKASKMKIDDIVCDISTMLETRRECENYQLNILPFGLPLKCDFDSEIFKYQQSLFLRLSMWH